MSQNAEPTPAPAATALAIARTSPGPCRGRRRPPSRRSATAPPASPPARRSSSARRRSRPPARRGGRSAPGRPGQLEQADQRDDDPHARPYLANREPARGKEAHRLGRRRSRRPGQPIAASCSRRTMSSARSRPNPTRWIFQVEDHVGGHRDDPGEHHHVQVARAFSPLAIPIPAKKPQPSAISSSWMKIAIGTCILNAA